MAMASKQSVNGEDEDPYKSEDGRIELKIEKLTAFVQEPVLTERLSDPIIVGGVPWKILAKLLERGEEGQKQKCLGYFLQCDDRSTDPFWCYSVTAHFKILAQKEGTADHVHPFRQIYNAKDKGWGPARARNITFEDIMNPDNGLYDVQNDSITLAVDFTAGKTVEEFGDYVLVAETELELDTTASNRFLMHVGNLGWEINSDAKSLVLKCKDVAKDRVDKVMLQLFGYHRNDPKSELYSPFPEKSAAVQCHLFTSKDNSLTVKVSGGILFTIRVYKERSKFPDFTQEIVMVGRFPADVKLRVGEQIFHANKLLLSSLSPFFDRNFNGLFDAAKQQELELSLDMHSPELFHHFLLVLCINEALPNSTNVAALFKLADFYDAENVRQKCDKHLRMAREMPVVKRMQLALDHGNKETRTLIVDSANLTQSKRINLLLMEHYPTKH